MGEPARPPDRSVRGSPPRGGGEAARLLDLRGEVCPYTFLKTKLALEELAAGTLLRVLVDNPESAGDVPRSTRLAGHAVLGVEALPGGVWAIVVRRAGPDSRHLGD